MSLIKVFSGSQLGATTSLNNNVDYTIGNHYECDIYLEDNINPRYECEFKVIDNYVVFSSIDEISILLNTSEIIQVGVRYEQPFYFMLGEIKLAIGVDIDQWCESVLDTDGVQSGDIDYTELGFIDMVESIDNNSDNTKVVKTRLKTRLMWVISLFIDNMIKLHNRHKIKLYIVVTIITIIIVVTISLFVTMNKYQQQSQKFVLTGQEDYNLKKKFTALPAKYSNLMLKKLINGYQINGLVAGVDDELYLKRYFQPFISMLTYKLITVADAQGKIQVILTNYNAESLNVAYNTDSQQLIVSGVTKEDMSKISEMEIEINNKLPEVFNISFLIFNLKQVISDVTVAMGDMSKFLNIQESGVKNQIRITGYLTQNQLTTVSGSLETLSSKYQNIITFKLDVENALSALPFKIYSVYNGVQPYIVTNTGQVVHVGGQIGDFILSEITDDKVMFKGDKFKLDIPLSQIGSDAVILENSSGGTSLSRKNILQNEYGKIKKLLAEEEKQLLMVHNHKVKSTDVELQKFLQQQEENLQQDIKLKQQDLNLLNKEVS